MHQHFITNYAKVTVAIFTHLTFPCLIPASILRRKLRKMFPQDHTFSTLKKKKKWLQ